MVSSFDDSSTALHRRRRLMTIAERADSDQVLSEFGVVIPEEGATPATVARTGDAVLSRLISERIWKHVLLIVPAAVTLLRTAWLTPAGEFHDLSHGTQEAILRTQQSQTLQGLIGLLLFVCAQLSFVIGMVRSRSQIDFAGRYRVWKWFGAALAACSVLALTGLYADLPAILAGLLTPIIGTVSAARRVLVLVPLSMFAVFVAFRVLPDMHRNRTGQWAVGAGALIAGMVAAAGYGNLSFQPERPLFSLMAAAAVSLLFTGMMLHSRYVLHVCSDPPISRAVSGRKRLTQPSDAALQSATASEAAIAAGGTTVGDTASASVDLHTDTSRKSRAVRKETAGSSGRASEINPQQESEAPQPEPDVKSGSAVSKKTKGRRSSEKKTAA